MIFYSIVCVKLLSA